MRYIKLTLLILIAVSATLPVFSQNCPQGPINNNNGAGNLPTPCITGDYVPSGWTRSGVWNFGGGPASNLTIFNVYRNGVLYQDANGLTQTFIDLNNASGNHDNYPVFGGYDGTGKRICFYGAAVNWNTPNNANWVITFSNASGAQCTYNVNGSGVITLPLTWSSISAQKQAGEVNLTWSTASEQNTKDFEVQYSTNTIQWSAVGVVPAAGNSNSTRSYSYIHQNPLKGNNYNYYRILQRDVDGKFSYSKIVSIIFNEPGAPVSLYPNPVHDVLTVFVETATSARLLNAAGATVWRGNLIAGRNQITVATFSKGVYMLATDKGALRVVIQ